MRDITITDVVSGELDTSRLDARARAGLRRCLPVLSDALDDWQANGAFTAPGIVAACATPDSFSMVHSTRWGEGVDDLDRGVVLHTLRLAIEANDPPLLIAALTATLGPQGRAAADRNAADITARGERPLLVVLAAADGDGTVDMLATIVALSYPAEPSRMIH